MVYQIIAALIALLSLGLLFITVKLLGNSRWLAGFIRGLSGLFILMLAFLVGLVAYDLQSYKSAKDGDTLGTISFREQQNQHFLVEVQQLNGRFNTFDLQGDQWEVRLRTFKWPPLMTASGLELGYRFDEIQSRFYTLDKRESGVTHQFEQSEYVDFWQVLYDKQLNPFGVRADIESLGLISLVDGAIFDIQVSGDRLHIKPMNESAQKAQNTW